jgi:short-subunit dehydrogenase
MAGMLGQAQMGPYSATKAAVVALSETLFQELKGTNVGVSVLCPGFARTGIADERPNPLAPEAPPVSKAGAERAAQLRLAVEAGLDPEEVAARTLSGVRDDDLYIFTHPEMRPWLDKRLERLRAAYDKADRFVS